MNFLKKIGYFLEDSEKRNPGCFCLLTGLCAMSLNFSSPNESYYTQSKLTTPFIEQTVSGPRALRIVGGDDQIRPSFRLGKRKKFDIVLHTILKREFPDWKARMDYQKKQEKLYKSAMRKQTEFKRVRMNDTSNLYTKHELDSIDYFHGTGSYKKHQDPSTKPNIFDTIQTFLHKMHDRTLRKNFLKSFKSFDNSNS